MAQATCEQRIKEELEGRLADIRKLWALQCAGDEEGDPDFNEYGLSFDYVAPGARQAWEEAAEYLEERAVFYFSQYKDDTGYRLTDTASLLRAKASEGQKA